MRSAELKKSGETAVQKRLRHRQVVSQLMLDLIAQCQDDEKTARAIGRRVVSGVGWAYTGHNGDAPDEREEMLRQRLITCWLVGYLVHNAAGRQDAQQIAQSLLEAIEGAWGGKDQRGDLRVVC